MRPDAVTNSVSLPLVPLPSGQSSGLAEEHELQPVVAEGPLVLAHFYFLLPGIGVAVIVGLSCLLIEWLCFKIA